MSNIYWESGYVSRKEREELLGQKGFVLWFTGLSGSGKTTLVKAILNLLKHSADTISIDGKIIWNIDGYEFDIINSDKKNMLKFGMLYVGQGG